MSWFQDWVGVYCQATGADIRTSQALLASESVFLREWNATLAELGECATRLVRDGRVPKFANEHTNALRDELHRLRSEAIDGQKPPAGDFAPDCLACGGSGFATIPLRACVWERRLILHPTHRRVMTGAVLCDRSGCVAGERIRDAESRRKDDKPRRPTLSRCEHAVGCDLVALLREHERDEALRATEGESDAKRLAEFARMYPRLAARIRGQL